MLIFSSSVNSFPSRRMCKSVFDNFVDNDHSAMPRPLWLRLFSYTIMIISRFNNLNKMELLWREVNNCVCVRLLYYTYVCRVCDRKHGMSNPNNAGPVCFFLLFRCSSLCRLAQICFDFMRMQTYHRREHMPVRSVCAQGNQHPYVCVYLRLLPSIY